MIPKSAIMASGEEDVEARLSENEDSKEKQQASKRIFPYMSTVRERDEDYIKETGDERYGRDGYDDTKGCTSMGT